MPSWNIFRNKKDRKDAKIQSTSPSFRPRSSEVRHAMNISKGGMAGSNPTSPFAAYSSDAPPSYDYQPPAPATTSTSSGAEDPYAFLSSFDTIFLIDDSGSMAGHSWRETEAAISSITPICVSHDVNGIDIYFLNQPDSSTYHNITRVSDVSSIFKSVRPRGGTPTGTRLNAILKPYLRTLEAKGVDACKPVNIIVITDGVPTDDVESVIIAAAKKLDKWEAPAWQVGIQFFQVGYEPGAAEALRELDDGLAEMGDGVRDMVDTVPWSGHNGGVLTADRLMKTVLGAVVRRLDRKKGSVEVRR